jgi:hypothetical protein
MSNLQILFAVSLQIVLVERLPIHILFRFVGNELSMQISTGNPNGNVPLCTDVQLYAQLLLTLLLHNLPYPLRRPLLATVHRLKIGFS